MQSTTNLRLEVCEDRVTPSSGVYAFVDYSGDAFIYDTDGAEKITIENVSHGNLDVLVGFRYPYEIEVKNEHKFNGDIFVYVGDAPEGKQDFLHVQNSYIPGSLFVKVPGDEGLVHVDIEHISVKNSIKLDLSAIGGDSVHMSNFWAGRDVKILGSDQIKMHDFSIGHELYINSLTGYDYVEIEHFHAPYVYISTDGGADDVYLYDFSSQYVYIKTGARSDYIYMDDFYAKSLYIDTDGGSDYVYLYDFSTNYLDIYTGSGDDYVDLAYFWAGTLYIDTDGGRDDVSLYEFSSNKVYIFTGTANDSVTIAKGYAGKLDVLLDGGNRDSLYIAEFSSNNVFLDGGAGNHDKLELKNVWLGNNPTIIRFEKKFVY